MLSDHDDAPFADMPADDTFRVIKEIQDVTNTVNAEITSIANAKKEEILGA